MFSWYVPGKSYRLLKHWNISILVDKLQFSSRPTLWLFPNCHIPHRTPSSLEVNDVPPHFYLLIVKQLEWQLLAQQLPGILFQWGLFWKQIMLPRQCYWLPSVNSEDWLYLIDGGCLGKLKYQYKQFWVPELGPWLLGQRQQVQELTRLSVSIPSVQCKNLPGMKGPGPPLLCFTGEADLQLSLHASGENLDPLTV